MGEGVEGVWGHGRTPVSARGYKCTHNVVSVGAKLGFSEIFHLQYSSIFFHFESEFDIINVLK